MINLNVWTINIHNLPQEGSNPGLLWPRETHEIGHWTRSSCSIIPPHTHLYKYTHLSIDYMFSHQLLRKCIKGSRIQNSHAWTAKLKLLSSHGTFIRKTNYVKNEHSSNNLISCTDHANACEPHLQESFSGKNCLNYQKNKTYVWHYNIVRK